MSGSSKGDLTQLLLDWRQGDEEALRTLTAIVYEELRRLARRYMRGERPGHTLQTTALVHEAYVRLVDSDLVRWKSRAHFLALTSTLMRRVLVDFARSRAQLKRGGASRRVSLNSELLSSTRNPDLLALDDALKDLTAFDPRKGQIVELRFFGGLSVQETAEVLNTSQRTVMRDWSLAKAWLRSELSKGGAG